VTAGPMLILDLAAFRENVRVLAEMVAPARCMIAVKANAYGHGMLPFARAAIEGGAGALAVLEVPAAIELREAGVEVPLFAWLHGERTDFAAAIAAVVPCRAPPHPGCRHGHARRRAPQGRHRTAP
jgi:alanine racemase